MRFYEKVQVMIGNSYRSNTAFIPLPDLLFYEQNQANSAERKAI
jgi:hypothetical protein